jgi:hypothetical protein
MSFTRSPWIASALAKSLSTRRLNAKLHPLYFDPAQERDRIHCGWIGIAQKDAKGRDQNV